MALILKDLKALPVTKDMVVREAERSLWDKFEAKKIRTRWQLRKTLAGMGALGLALKGSLAVKAMEALMAGDWLPKSWQAVDAGGKVFWA